MQKIATRVFVVASLCFGAVGLMMVLSGNFGPNVPDDQGPNPLLFKMLFTCVFVILPSFALSVAGKYLQDK
jgi:hypothetical protein